MKRTAFYFCLLLTAVLAGSFLPYPVQAAEKSLVTPVELTVESAVNPAGVDTLAPRLGWKALAKENSFNLVQEAYQILAASDKKILAENKGDLWDTGKVISDRSIQIEYKGKPLTSSKRVFWKVRVWYNGTVSNWSAPGQWIMGIIKPQDWAAMWIAQQPKFRSDLNMNGAFWIAADQKADKIFLRKEINIDLPKTAFDNKDFFGAFRYAGNQKFNIFVNGKKVGHSIGMIFNPDLLRTIDVSDALVPGKNVIAVEVTNNTKDPIGFLARFELIKINKIKGANVYPEKISRRGTPGKTIMTVNSDKNWLAAVKTGKGWETSEFKTDKNWTAAKEIFAIDEGPWGKVRRVDEKEQPVFYRTVKIAKPVKYATLHISGLGFYEAALDGQKFSKLLDPPPTKYDRRVLYSTYDLTDQMTPGDHELSVVLGHSWYDVRSIVTWNFDACPWREAPKMIAQLEIVYQDGTKETVRTDETWTYSNSPVIFDCLRQGEIVDGNFKRIDHGTVAHPDAPKGILSSNMVAQSKIIEEFKPKSVSEVSPGVYVVDLGWNIAGWCRVKINNSKQGDRIRFKYSERIIENGQIERHTIEQHFMEGTPSWMTGEVGGFQTDYYFCRGDKTETFEPRFTYNGFQFLEITGLREKPSLDDITVCRINNDFARTGWFQCGNELFNKISEATRFSYMGNFVMGIPTDCPHREKNGWTGDAQLACEYAMYEWENTNGYEKWITDLLDEQQPDGNLPGIVPTGSWGYPWGNGPAWDCSLTMIPWYLYLYRGDRRILEKSYGAIQLYLEFISAKATDNIVKHGLSDWCCAKTRTPVEITSTGYYYLDCMIAARIAEILGKKNDAAKYSALANAIRDSYNAKLGNADGVYGNGSQTSQSTPLHQGLANSLSADQQKKIFGHLVQAVEKSNGFIDFGILGSKYIYRTLSEFGRTDLCLKMALQEKQPSYADWIKRGAGTLWEDWGDGSSRNHIMYGDIAAWQYQSLAGIKLAGAPQSVVADFSKPAPYLKKFMGDKIGSDDMTAFKTFVIEPKCRPEDIKVEGRQPVDWVDAKINSPYGKIVSSWKWNKRMTEMTFDISIPVNTKAFVILPFAKKDVAQTKGAKTTCFEENGASVRLCGSGNYSFRVSR